MDNNLESQQSESYVVWTKANHRDLPKEGAVIGLAKEQQYYAPLTYMGYWLYEENGDKYMRWFDVVNEECFWHNIKNIESDWMPFTKENMPPCSIDIDVDSKSRSKIEMAEFQMIGGLRCIRFYTSDGKGRDRWDWEDLAGSSESRWRYNKNEWQVITKDNMPVYHKRIKIRPLSTNVEFSGFLHRDKDGKKAMPAYWDKLVGKWEYKYLMWYE